MFTGIVEEIGVVSELNPHDATGGTSLTVSLPAGSDLLSDAHEGDSIAVNGVCLTVVSFFHPTSSSSHQTGTEGTRKETPWFTVGIAPETLRLTNLGSLTASSRVNLERAVRASTRMGGHFVQGHVDGLADVAAVTPDGNALTVRLAPRDSGSSAGAIMRYVVRKGFVALDGTSLTITKVDDAEGWFEVMLISYTQERVALAAKKPGDSVNVEVDVLAKYAEKSMAGFLEGLAAGGGDGSGNGSVLEKMVERIVAQGLGGRA